MREGTASQTAQNVAARRLEFARIEAAYGDPAADEGLTSDVADGLVPADSRMHEYLRARTAFFDRVVVTALDRGISQVVIGGAGYDGRAFRYAKPGVRWFEVDHPATQADKRERIARLGLGTAHIAFIAADFTADLVAAPLREAGLDQALPALFLFEGVAVYLERHVIESVLTEFRAVTAPGAALAISVSSGAPSSTRAAFQRRVASLGEPARTVLAPAEMSALLAAAGWEVTPPSDRQRSAGLLLARAASAAGTERVRPAPAPPRLPAAVADSPASRGIASRAAWPGFLAEVESRWRDRLGGGRFSGLRNALAAIVARLDPTLPDCLPILGYGLVSPLDPDQASFPPPAVQAAGLPLWALLSRTRSPSRPSTTRPSTTRRRARPSRSVPTFSAC